MIAFNQAVAAAFSLEDLLELKSIMDYVNLIVGLKQVEPCMVTEDAEKWFELLSKCIEDYVNRPL